MTMATIKTQTGSEWHSSYGAKGYVFVVQHGQEAHIYQSQAARLIEQEWQNVDSRGVHGKWCAASYEIADGTVLKLFATGTRHDRTDEGGAAFFVVDSMAPVVAATGGTYAGRGGSIEGPIRRLSLEEVAALGIAIDPRYKKLYQGGITVAVLEVAA
jgi:hypothetical protein